MKRAAEFLAEMATTGETPGVHRDELADALIIAARRWIEREKLVSRDDRNNQ